MAQPLRTITNLHDMPAPVHNPVLHAKTVAVKMLDLRKAGLLTDDELIYELVEIIADL